MQVWGKGKQVDLREQKTERLTNMLREGMVPSEIYSDEELHHKEQDTVFTRSWLFVGHESMVPNTGDYITSYMGEDSVIVIRDRAGKIRVHLNKCTHRGNKVCLFDRGNASVFTCSYHGWSFDTEGKLRGVPELKESYLDNLNKEEKGLVQAKVETYGGLIFACWNHGVIPLEEYLGDMRWYLDNFFLFEEMGGLEVVPGKQRNTAPINWKLEAENFVGDHYHFKTTHASLVKISGDIPVGPLHMLAKETATTSFEVTIGYRTGVPHSLGQLLVGPQYYEEDLRQAAVLGPEAVDWVRQRREYIEKRLKDLPYKPYGFNRFHIFPNLSMVHATSALSGHAFLLWHPRGPVGTEVWEWCAVNKAAPEIVKKAAVQGIIGGQSVAGMVGPDDAENFSRIADNVQTPVARKQAFDYSLGLGYEGDRHPALKGLDVNEVFPGLLSYHTTEINQREFLRYWAELVKGEESRDV